MKVFLIWSGDRSKQVAQALHGWLPKVIQAVKPWMSNEDVEKGKNWPQELSQQLDEARLGIVCLDKSNLTAPWLLFEAGALSKSKDTIACPFLLDVKSSEVRPPLGHLQNTVTTSKEGSSAELVGELQAHEQ